LVQPHPDVRMGRVSLQALIRLRRQFIGWGNPI
jgi:hypothetical protein